MSAQVFPSLPGITFDIERNIIWNTQVQEAISGKETRVGYWSAARYTWSLTFEFLRASTTFNEFQNLFGFFSARQGRFDSFLYSDDTDNATTGSQLGVGDSTVRTFQLLRRFGGSSAISEPVLAPNTVTRVTVAGSSVSSTQFTVGAWGSSVPGIITFSTFAPSVAQAVTADFSYYFPCRFDEDAGSFVEFMSKLWENKKLIIKSIK
jgi:uncharacterized protein (TIGR02217 family)